LLSSEPARSTRHILPMNAVMKPIHTSIRNVVLLLPDGLPSLRPESSSVVSTNNVKIAWLLDDVELRFVEAVFLDCAATLCQQVCKKVVRYQSAQNCPRVSVDLVQAHLYSCSNSAALPASFLVKSATTFSPVDVVRMSSFFP
jgi:hypothetical protein